MVTANLANKRILSNPNLSKSELRDLWCQYLPDEAACFEEVHAFFRVLWDTNQQVNLFSRKLDPKSVFIDHIIDSALGLPYFDQSQIILDFGCGGGLPGAVLACCRPLKNFILFDKSNKKIHYLSKACKLLDLENCICLSEPDLDRFSEIDTLTSRAVASTAKILTWHQTVIPEQSCQFLLYKARRESIDEELKELPENQYDIQVHPLDYPEGLKERHLIELHFK